MRKIVLPLAAITLLFTASCNDSPKADLANSSEAVNGTSSDAGTTLNLDLSKSKVEWIGSKPVGKQHNGTIDITKGGLVTDNGNLVGGYFIINTKSITPLDQNEEDNGKLRAHLLSEDFFDAEKHPEGTFEITSVEPISEAGHLENKDANHMITGNLTLKGITKSITFPAVVQESENQVIADAHFNIIRTDWNINFNSDESLKDKFINKELNLKVHIEAQKS